MKRRRQMYAMRFQGLTYQKIADEFGVSKQYVAKVCGNCCPPNFRGIDEKCIYPNLKKWMNDNYISRAEFLRRMGISAHTSNYQRFTAVMRGETQPKKDYIDKMLAVTGLTYEILFEVDQSGSEQ